VLCIVSIAISGFRFASAVNTMCNSSSRYSTETFAVRRSDRLESNARFWRAFALRGVTAGQQWSPEMTLAGNRIGDVAESVLVEISVFAHVTDTRRREI